MISIASEPASANAITHPGIFHADDVLATVVLERALGDVRVCRTRDIPASSRGGKVVYDVGGGKYDHHQAGGNGCRGNGVPYASAGLVWRDFGPEVLEGIGGAAAVWDELDETLFQPVDAADNGVVLDSAASRKEASLSGIVSSFNPNWDEDSDGDAQFLAACAFMRIAFERLLAQAAAKEHARVEVEEAVGRSDGQVVFLDRFMPWKEALFSLGTPKAESALFVIYPDKVNGWNWQCVPDSPHGYGQRIPAPESWRGLSGRDLQLATGVRTAVFCHRGGFMGAARDREDAERMVRQAISCASGRLVSK